MAENNYIQFTGRLKATSLEGILAEAQQIAISGSDNTNVKEYIDNRTKTVKGLCSTLDDYLHAASDILVGNYDYDKYGDLADNYVEFLESSFNVDSFPINEYNEEYTAREYVDEQIKLAADEESDYLINAEDSSNKYTFWNDYLKIQDCKVLYFKKQNEFLFELYNSDRNVYKYKIIDRSSGFDISLASMTESERGGFFKHLVDQMKDYGVILGYHIAKDQFLPVKIRDLGVEYFAMNVLFPNENSKIGEYISIPYIIKDVYSKINKVSEKLTMS